MTKERQWLNDQILFLSDQAKGLDQRKQKLVDDMLETVAKEKNIYSAVSLFNCVRYAIFKQKS